MTQQLEFRIALHPLETLFGHARAHLRGIHPLSDGSAVLHLSTRQGPLGKARTWLVVADANSLRPLQIPAAVKSRIDECAKDPVTEKASYGAPRSFQLGDRIGLLVTDRWAWVFDPLRGTEPVEVAIEPLALAGGVRSSRSYFPDRCGTGRDGRVPVIFRHPDAWPDYPCYLSTLELDLDAGRGRWSLQSSTGEPIVVPYRVDPDDFNGVPQYAGTILADALWLGDRFRLFTIGNRTHYGRMGMAYVSVIECDGDGGNPRVVREIDESAHGLFAADGRHLLLLPFTKRGPRKGKPSLIDLETGLETPLAIRGLASYKPQAFHDGRIWMAGGAGAGSWASWDELALSDSDGDRGEVVACRLA
jgi:hypothetical protein